MSDRVLSTIVAKETITQMKALVNGPLVEQINQLQQQGNTLSDPNIWDGNLALNFRNQQWPPTYQSILAMQQQLDALRAQIELINQNIMTAGGNA